MTAWLLLLLTVIFVHLTYDALSAATPTLPYQETARALGLGFSHASPGHRSKHQPAAQRLENSRLIAWIFGLAAAAFGFATLHAFIR